MVSIDGIECPEPLIPVTEFGPVIVVSQQPEGVTEQQSVLAVLLITIMSTLLTAPVISNRTFKESSECVIATKDFYIKNVRVYNNIH